MTAEQAKATAEAYFSHKLNYVTSHKDMILHTFLEKRFPPKDQSQLEKPPNYTDDNNAGSPSDQSIKSEDTKKSEFTREVQAMEDKLHHKQQAPTSNDTQKVGTSTDLQMPAKKEEPVSSHNTETKK